jgi:hypothetical protein
MKRLLPLGLALLLLSAAYLLLRSPSAPEPQLFDFALTAVSEEGQPLAGARVFLQGEEVGLTNSFGQWQKTQSLAINRVLHIIMKKSTTEGELEGIKNIELSPARRDEKALAVHHTIKLLAKASSALRSRGMYPTQDDSLTSLWFQLLAPPNAATPAQREHYRYLEKGLIPALYQNARLLGVQVHATSAWQMNLSTLQMPDGLRTPALLRVVARHPHRGESIDFLTGVTGTPGMVAQEIFRKLRFHINSKFSPHGWKRYSLRLAGVDPKKAAIYVSGFKAEAAEDSLWHYWGKSQQQAYLSVVVKGRVVYRQRLAMGVEVSVEVPKIRHEEEVEDLHVTYD